MGLILVRKLFEVRILHEYYLSKPEGGSFFELPPAEQEVLLKSRLFYGQYGLMKDLLINPTQECAHKLRANKLFFARTALGFVVGIEVEARKINDGAGGLKEVYRPRQPVDPYLALEFSINNSNPYFATITNGRFRNTAPARYYFSNRDSGSLKSPPAISRPLPGFLPGRLYEMGEMSKIDGLGKEALKVTSSDNPSDWADVAAQGVVNEQDRLLLPRAFTYSFNRSGVTSAEFVLKNQDGSEVKRIAFGGGGGLANVRLDFRTKGFDGGQAAEEISSGFYILEASGSSNYQEILPVYLNDSLYQRSNWGAIEVSFQPGRPEFGLFTPDGDLIIEKQSNGSFNPSHPRFELRIRARKTIWRYKSILGKTLKKDVKNVTSLNETGGHLVARSPRAFSASPITFTALDQLNQQQDVFLPMPAADSLREEAGQFYSDIYISYVKDIIKAE